MKRSSVDYNFSVKTKHYGDEVEYVVIFDDFPNLIGAGDTVEEAIQEGRENLDVYINYCYDHSIPLPPPSDYEIKRCDYSGKVTLRMSKALHERASITADIEGVSLNAFVNEAIANYISVLEKHIFMEAVDNIKRIFPAGATNYIFLDNNNSSNSDLNKVWEDRTSNSLYESANKFMGGMVAVPSLN